MSSQAVEVDARCSNPQRPAGAAQDGGPRRQRVLLVDDERGILSSLRRLLRNEPYEILVADSGKQALAVLEQRASVNSPETPVELVVSDQLMPEMTGLELLREVRRRWPTTIGVILSGYTEVNTIIQAINEGEIYKFLTKPWNDEELKLNLRRAIEQSALASENRRMSREILEQNAKLRELNELLNRRAADATFGLNFAQQLLESLDVGVIGVDDTGTIVWANRRARALLPVGEGDLIGASLPADLPPDLCEVLSLHATQSRPPVSGVCAAGQQRLCFRISTFGAEDAGRGAVAAFWEAEP